MAGTTEADRSLGPVIMCAADVRVNCISVQSLPSGTHEVPVNGADESALKQTVTVGELPVRLGGSDPRPRRGESMPFHCPGPVQFLHLVDAQLGRLGDHLQ